MSDRMVHMYVLDINDMYQLRNLLVVTELVTDPTKRMQ